jgi:multimeric flavodoxin WrbA
VVEQGTHKPLVLGPNPSAATFLFAGLRGGTQNREEVSIMKVMAFNGSPRKKDWNTVTLLNNALRGAISAGADTELVQLYDLRFSGCVSCFSCKKLNRKEDGVCAVKDDLTAVLRRVKDADALIIGTPVYYGAESASTRALLERLCFPYLKYDFEKLSTFPRRIKTAMIYTMNARAEMLEPMGLDRKFDITKMILQMHFGECEILLATDTLQYSDYDKFESLMFDKATKYKHHSEVFPEDCKRAFELGVRIASEIPESE